MYDGCSLLSSLDREPSCCLNIMYEGSRHYNPILNLKAAAGSRGGYCVACNVGFRNDRSHRCTKKCPRCYDTLSCERPDVELIKCDSCVRVFFGRPCFKRHRAQGSYKIYLNSNIYQAFANPLKFCNGCGRLVNSKSRYDCDVIYCKTCRSLQSSNHLCYMRLFVVKPQ